MNPALQHLLDLRRESEACAQQALAAARAAGLLTEEEQARLRARASAACETLASESRRQATASLPVTAAMAAAGAAYLGRLRNQTARLAQLAEEHQTHALAAAKAAEDTAQAAYEEARHAREAVEKLMAREEDQQQHIADRRAEDAASDLAQAAFVRRRTEESK